jgi:subtilase family serine protease
MKHTLAVLAIVALAGCSGAGAVPGGSAHPSLAAPTASLARAARDAATGDPGESNVGLPGENNMGLPGENNMGLPGENNVGLPGASFACPGVPATGTASCTVAVNLNVAPNANPNQPPSLIPGLHPADLQNAYALPAQNAGATVAVVDAYDDPFAEADLAVYRTAFGLPPCTTQNGCFRKVNQRGQTGSYPAANAAWSEEIALDLDMVSAACPQCSIVLVEADSALIDDLGSAVDTAAGLGAKAIGNSYYAVEWAQETSEDAHYRHDGVAVTASSGDRGYPSYPAASRYVTSVGGTSLSGSSGAWSESAWQYTGHGCSAYVAKPAWQAVAPCSRSRSAVDIAFVADPQTGVATFNAQAGGWYVAGGTSVGAPLAAAAYALSGRPAAPSYAYAHPAAFRAVGAGGYQSVTGLGSPAGVAGL